MPVSFVLVVYLKAVVLNQMSNWELSLGFLSLGQMQNEYFSNDIWLDSSFKQSQIQMIIL